MARQAAMLLFVTDDGLLMHLRDDKPGIPHPGCWSGFGGAVEDGGTVNQAMRREVREETGLEISDATFLTCEVDHESDPIDELPWLTTSPFARRAIRSHLLPIIAPEGP